MDISAYVFDISIYGVVGQFIICASTLGPKGDKGDKGDTGTINDASFGSEFYWDAGKLSISENLFLKETSIGSGLYWNAGLLDVSAIIVTDPSINGLYNYVNDLSTFAHTQDSSIPDLYSIENSQNVSIGWLNSNKLETDDLYPYATNSSVGLAIQDFATNSSIGLAIEDFATNSSVNTALGAYATNSSIGLAGFIKGDSLYPYATNSSVGANMVPYSGATLDVSLNSRNIKELRSLGFILNPTGYTFQEGLLHYDPLFKTLVLDTDLAHSLRLGQSSNLVVYNSSTGTFPKGKAVYINGQNGIYPTINYAAAGITEAQRCVGLTGQDILPSSLGFVTSVGIITDISTNQWNVSDVLYLDISAGELTSTPPPAPYADSEIGVVMVSNPVNGAILIDLQLAKSLTALIDVTVSTPQVDQILKYNGLEWVNAASGTTSAGQGVTVYLDDISSNITGYKKLLFVPGIGIEHSQQVSVSSANSPLLINSFVSSSEGLGRTQIDPGLWKFGTYSETSFTSGDNKILIDVYRRNNVGTEFLLFSSSTADMSVTNTVIYDETQTIQPNFDCSIADVLVVKYYAYTTSSTPRNQILYYNGSAHYTHIDTPLATLHNDLAGLQGGIGTERYHITVAEKIVVGNTSGVNTGNQDLSPYALTTDLNPFATNASVGTAIQNFATNSSVNNAGFLKAADLGSYATNASVGLAIENFATNASVGLAIENFATNSSVNAALGTYATNASVGIALYPYATNVSVGTAFDQRDASIVILRGKDLDLDASIVLLIDADKTFATNASVGIALYPYATNASVGTALAPFATNSSIGLAGFEKTADSSTTYLRINDASTTYAKRLGGFTISNAAYLVNASDNNNFILIDTSALTVTFPNTLPVGFSTVVVNETTGICTLNASTLLSQDSSVVLRDRYASCTVICKSAGVYLAIGNLK